jgi:hypothetical protein
VSEEVSDSGDTTTLKTPAIRTERFNAIPWRFELLVPRNHFQGYFSMLSAPSVSTTAR